MPDRVRSIRPATADNRLKGSDRAHDHHDEPEDSQDGGGCRPDTPDGDRADDPQDGDQPEGDSSRNVGQSTAGRGAERAVDGSSSSAAGHRPELGRVTLKTTPEGAAWVLVEGSDFAELTERINAVFDALTRPARR